MDFEYGYLNLMTNMHTFIRRAQTIYSRMETRISSISITSDVSVISIIPTVCVSIHKAK